MTTCLHLVSNIFLSLPFQVILQEEKKVIHALRRGVETQDYSTVKGLLAQAEKMGLSGEEVKQAQAMRLRIEVGHRHRRRLWWLMPSKRCWGLAAEA